MKKTLAVMQVLTLCQCGGSFQCLPRYVADGHRKRYHTALHSLELAVDKIAIITTAINEPGISMDVVSPRLRGNAGQIALTWFGGSLVSEVARPVLLFTICFALLLQASV